MLDRPARTFSRTTWRLIAIAAIAQWLPLLPRAAASDQRFTPVVKAAQKTIPAVVSIRGEKTVLPSPQEAGADAPRRVNGMGTGIVIDARGYILTNFHVVDGVREIQVTYVRGKEIYCRRRRPRPRNRPGPDQDQSRREAAGNRAGHLRGPHAGRVRRGCRQRLRLSRHGYRGNRQRAAPLGADQRCSILRRPYPDFRADQSGQFGRSAGEYRRRDDRRQRGGEGRAQGIGFAIPVDKAVSVAASLMASAGGKSWHGLVPAADAPAAISGMKLASVEKKSPAAEAGLQSGDVITAVGETDIHRALDFQREMLGRKAGDKLDLTVQREGHSLSVSLVLADTPDAATAGDSGAWDLLGLDLRVMPGSEFKEKFHTRYRGGLVVVSVRQNSPAADQGIRAGDVLVGMHIWETVSLDNVAYVLRRPDFTSINPVKFFILRGNDTLYGFMPINLKVARQP